MINAIEIINELNENSKRTNTVSTDGKNDSDALLFKTLLDKAMNKNNTAQLSTDRLSQVPLAGVLIPKAAGESRDVSKKRNTIIASYGSAMG